MRQRTSTRCKCGETKIDNHTLQLFLLHEFRYALYRQTGVIEDCVRNITKHWDIISPCFQAQIQQDIIDAIDRQCEKYPLYGESNWRNILLLPLKDDDL